MFWNLRTRSGQLKWKKNQSNSMPIIELAQLYPYRVQQLSHSQHFGVGVEIYQVALKRNMVISADIFTVLLQHFLTSYGNLVWIIQYNLCAVPVGAFGATGRHQYGGKLTWRLWKDILKTVKKVWYHGGYHDTRGDIITTMEDAQYPTVLMFNTVARYHDTCVGDV